MRVLCLRCGFDNEVEDDENLEFEELADLCGASDGICPECGSMDLDYEGGSGDF